MDATLAWARSLFRRYYRREPVFLPPRFGRREYGFLFLGEKGMQRHTRFATREDLSRFLADKGPSHAYYSVAYYAQPEASRMEDKGWKGADLIFDLDADHMPGADEMSQADMLEEIRQEALKVVEEFLLGHFGFTEDDLRIAFSGGRGYHIHVIDPSVHSLGSQERREIVDYVTGNGLVIERLLGKEIIGSDRFAGLDTLKTRWVFPSGDEPGWPGLIARTVARKLEGVLGQERNVSLAELEDVPGIGSKRASKILAKLDSDGVRQIRRGNVDWIPEIAKAPILRGLIEDAHVSALGEADEPVTADVKRLIRLPGSLHGKTGLRVTPLTVDGLKGFKPLRDAVALPEDPVTLELERPAEGELAGQTFELAPGTHQVPTYLAAFVALPMAATSAPWRPRIGPEAVA